MYYYYYYYITIIIIVIIGGGGGGADGDGAWAMGLTFTWWGCYGLCLTQTNRACPLLFILFLCLFLSFCPFQLYFIP